MTFLMNNIPNFHADTQEPSLRELYANHIRLSYMEQQRTHTVIARPSGIIIMSNYKARFWVGRNVNELKELIKNKYSYNEEILCKVN